MEAAERRDLNMFYRLVNGIRERQVKLVKEHEAAEPSGAVASSSDSVTVDQHGRCQHPRAALHAMETERSIAHIIYTRNANTQSNSYFQYHHDTASTSGGPRQLDPINHDVLTLEGFPTPLIQPVLYNPLHRRGDAAVALAATAEDWSVSGFDQESTGMNPVSHPSSRHQLPVDVATGTSRHYSRRSSDAPPFPTEADDGIFDFDL
jgi:hypothetical protein